MIGWLVALALVFVLGIVAGVPWYAIVIGALIGVIVSIIAWASSLDLWRP